MYILNMRLTDRGVPQGAVLSEQKLKVPGTKDGRSL